MFRQVTVRNGRVSFGSLGTLGLVEVSYVVVCFGSYGVSS